ncbi:MAG: hypothetical protein HUU25_15540 [Candidatus Sumerlaeia bacterium]|nr:hypothetical protein [Candidatus Sumerlaeia bacterium]
MMEEIPSPPRVTPLPVRKTDVRRGEMPPRLTAPPAVAPDPMEDLLDATHDEDEGPPPV